MGDLEPKDDGLIYRLLAVVADASVEELVERARALVPSDKLIPAALQILADAGLTPDAAALTATAPRSDLHGEQWLLEQDLVRQALGSARGRPVLHELTADTLHELLVEYGFSGGSSRYTPGLAKKVIHPAIRRLGWAYYATNGFTAGSDAWAGGNHYLKPRHKARFLRMVKDEYEVWLEQMDPDQLAALAAYPPYEFLGSHKYTGRPRSGRVIGNLRAAGEEFLVLKYFELRRAAA